MKHCRRAVRRPAAALLRADSRRSRMLKNLGDLFIIACGTMYSASGEYLALDRRCLKNHRRKAGLRGIATVILP
jgi:hypothetical protein